MDVDELRQRLARYSERHFVFLRRRLPPAQAEEVVRVARELGIKGIELRREYRRYYPAGEVFSHLIGFTDLLDKGQEGLERAYDAALSGDNGAKRVLRDGRRQVVEDVESIRIAQPGDNLALSLDQRLQYIAYRELKAAVQTHDAIGGSLVLLDVESGEVLAMVNQPAFNPNGDRSSRGGRLRNRALTDVFEPGSTMKPFTVAIGLELGTVDLDTRIDTAPGYFRVGSAQVRDHHNLGLIDLPTLIRKSSNVGAGRIALDLPRESYWQYLSALGFGVDTGSAFPGEASGQLTAPHAWARIDQATLSFGYGLSVTTAQLAQAYSVIAADGVRKELSVLRRSEPPQGERVFSPEVARAVRGMMVDVVSREGTAPKAAVAGYRVAGKTGTVRKAGPGGYSEKRYRSIFAGMAPADAPRLVMVVVIDEPRGDAYYGGQVAAPVFSRVMDDALRLLNVPPDVLPADDARLAAGST
jgi:cell division protein FtsI (penicillin-binding protein 3)